MAVNDDTIPDKFCDFERKLPPRDRPSGVLVVRSQDPTIGLVEMGLSGICAHLRFRSVATNQLGIPPPEVDTPSMIDSRTLPECLVNSVRYLEYFLTESCKLFQPNDLRIMGPHLVDGGGFAEA